MAGSFGLSSHNSGQTASPFGLSSHNSGQTTSPFGLSSTNSGQTASPFGLSSTNSGQTASPFDLSSHNSGLTTIILVLVCILLNFLHFSTLLLPFFVYLQLNLPQITQLKQQLRRSRIVFLHLLLEVSLHYFGLRQYFQGQIGRASCRERVYVLGYVGTFEIGTRD